MICPTCGGSGETKDPEATAQGKVTCPTCGGSGAVPEAPAGPAPADEAPGG